MAALRPSGHLPDFYMLIHDDGWWAWHIRDSNEYLSRGNVPSPQIVFSFRFFLPMATLIEHQLAWPIFIINLSPLNTTQWSLSSYIHSTTYGSIYPLISTSSSTNLAIRQFVHLSIYPPTYQFHVYFSKSHYMLHWRGAVHKVTTPLISPCLS